MPSHMTWQPGQPLLSASDTADWQAWRKARKLEQQRARRRQYPRIDYYPGKEAQAIIMANAGNHPGGDYSTVIDRLILSGHWASLGNKMAQSNGWVPELLDTFARAPAFRARARWRRG